VLWLPALVLGAKVNHGHRAPKHVERQRASAGRVGCSGSGCARTAVAMVYAVPMYRGAGGTVVEAFFTRSRSWVGAGALNATQKPGVAAM
jgi:hypothetical protein